HPRRPDAPGRVPRADGHARAAEARAENPRSSRRGRSASGRRRAERQDPSRLETLPAWPSCRADAPDEALVEALAAVLTLCLDLLAGRHLEPAERRARRAHVGIDRVPDLERRPDRAGLDFRTC